MNLLAAIAIGTLGGAAVYLLLRPSWVKLILGLALLGHAVNLLIFTGGGLSEGFAPIIEAGQEQLVVQPHEPSSDPLPQALILTAIVIGFGMQAFLVVLVRKAYSRNRTLDVDELEEVEK